MVDMYIHHHIELLSACMTSRLQKRCAIGEWRRRVE